MSQRLVALVIGNSNYVSAGALKNPAHDADDIAAKLTARGFTVTKQTDCSNKAMDLAIKKFKADIAGNDVAVFFFAGHGMQVEGENYLAAIDTDTAGEDEAKHSSLPLNRVINVMEKGPTSINIIILDACRDNPFERSWHRSAATRGLAAVYAPKGTLIAYATSPGQFALDGRGRNGAYTAALLQHIDAPDCSIENMFKRVRNTLSAATKQKQISWEHTSLSAEFFFNLSLGVRINIYKQTALSDSLFVIDEAKTSHRLIRALKSQTWPIQNPAVNEVTAAVANTASTDSLFVLGRNIYQAACGGSRTAEAFIHGFMTRSSEMRLEKRKALLDGMLFEVFYDPNATLRAHFKSRKLQDLFRLQQYSDLESSFDFIAECLLPQADRFYVIPGKRHAIVVDVVTSPDVGGNKHILEAVHCSGLNILWLEDEEYAVAPGEKVRGERLTIEKFERILAEQMTLPKHLLSVNYLGFSMTGNETILYPNGFTTAKR